jgi:beta-galactosidase
VKSTLDDTIKTGLSVEMSVANYGNGDLVEKANYTPIKPASPVLGYELIDAKGKVLASASATVSVKGRGENDYKFPKLISGSFNMDFRISQPV